MLWWKTKEEEKEKPKIGCTDITVIFDRSGSMQSMKEAVVEGYNTQVKKMRETPGDTRWSLVQFDDPQHANGAKEAFPQIVFENKGEKEVPLLEPNDFLPRGGTALVDAMCKTIKQIRKRQESLASGSQGQVVVMVVTDGEENSSREYTTPQMREMIGECYSSGWQFIYLGANQDAFAVAGQYNMAQGNLAQYAGNVPVLSGGLNVAMGTNSANSYDPTAAGMRAAIGSGFVGCSAIVSGSIRS